MKVLLKIILILVILLGAVAAWYYFIKLPELSRSNPAKTLSDELFGWKFPVAKFPSAGSDQLAYSDIRDPGGIPQGLPVRLKIPIIGVDSVIEDALITPDGRMDVPAGSVNVAWFALGPHPGKEGSAVIGGHFGIDNGVPKVFFNLNKLKVGDKIYILDDQDQTLAFVVRSISLFGRNDDSTTVFTSSDGLAHLNLITCEGIWNQVNNTYPERRVVFTDAIASEGAVSVKPKVKPKLPSTAMVTTPQPTIEPTTILPTPVPTVIVAPLTSLKNAKSLYATPVDTLISSGLLFLIFFAAFKIIHR